MKYERQFVSVIAFISNTGNLTKWEFHEHYNLKETNEQFFPDFKNQIDLIMKDMNQWTPGTLNGRDVNSKIWLDISLDRETITATNDH